RHRAALCRAAARALLQAADPDRRGADSLGEIGALDAREAVRHHRARCHRRAAGAGGQPEGRGPQDLRGSAAGAGRDSRRRRRACHGADELRRNPRRDRGIRCAEKAQGCVSFSDTFVEVDGCKTHLRRAGKGEPLLFLHGASGAPAIMPFMEKLAQRFDVLVPEHPGWGKSDEPAWLENIHDVAYFYLDFLKRLDLRNVTVVGSSMGGWIAMEMAVRDTSRLKSLVLVSPAGIAAPGVLPADIFLMPP